jgi:hypothetical protein
MHTDRGSYANARDILPGEVLRMIQAHFEGGLLWVPPQEARRGKTRNRQARDEEILAEKGRGVATKALAEKYGLSEERIRQIARHPKTAN